MDRVVSVEQMIGIEQAADAAGHSYDDMMRMAGKAVAEAAIDLAAPITGKRVTVLVGSGNNGGDGLVAANLLAQAGGLVSIYLAKERPEPDPHLDTVRDGGLLVAEAGEDQRWRVLRNLIRSCDVLIDGLLGTGLKLPLRGTTQKILELVKSELSQRQRAPITIAIDCPSGLDCDTGELAEEALKMDATVTFAAAKTGLLRSPGAYSIGELIVADIGIPKDIQARIESDLALASAQQIREWLPDRPRDSHKGTFGSPVIVAGSITMPGAAALAGLAAYRSGAGLVTLATPASVQSLVAAQLPEAIWILLPHELGQVTESAVDVLRDEMKQADALLVGPGLGRDRPAQAFMGRFVGMEVAAHRGKLGFLPKSGGEDNEAVVESPPLVVDADGLNLLSDIPEWWSRLPSGSILTPHPGEMARLTGLKKEDVQAERIEIAQKFAAQWGHVVVLKGAFTIIAEPDGRTFVVPIASSALSTAGSGDVLAGLIVGLLAQSIEPLEAAVAGAYLHGRAGELAAETLGGEAAVMAGDIGDHVPEAIAEVNTAVPASE